MDRELSRSLSEINARFYRQANASFSATRRAGWPGWERVLAHAGVEGGGPVDVLDLACGNLRLERFLAERKLAVRAWAYDSCDSLVAGVRLSGVRYRHLDVMDALFEGRDLATAIDAPACDLCVSFGFLHHVALPEHRAAILRALLAHTRPGGIACVSLWQFARDERILSKAEPVQGGADGDYLLGWQESDLKRYCHSFSEDEVDELARGVRDLSCELDRFSADGKRGDLNRYIVLRRLGRLP